MKGNKKKNLMLQRLTRRIVLWIFVLFVATALVVFGIVSILQNFWEISEDDSVWWYLFVTLMLSIIIGTVLSFIYSRIMAKATAPYIEALQKVKDCDFSVRIKDVPMFEDLQIAQNFNNMVSQLGSVETLREEFVSDFSHEFKTPIVSIAGFAKLLKDPNLSASDRNEFLDVIIDESNRLVELSESVLMLSRLDSQTVVKESYRLDEQLRQCVLLFSNVAAGKKIALEIDCDAIEINTSKKLASQVWLNLLSNAVKFTQDGGKITVIAKDVGNEISVVVSDTGCGMDEEMLQHIFNKFYQGEKSRTISGNGLGLAIVKKILELLDGKITVASQVNEGSTFTVTLKK